MVNYNFKEFVDVLMLMDCKLFKRDYVETDELIPMIFKTINYY